MNFTICIPENAKKLLQTGKVYLYLYLRLVPVMFLVVEVKRTSSLFTVSSYPSQPAVVYFISVPTYSSLLYIRPNLQ